MRIAVYASGIFGLEEPADGSRGRKLPEKGDNENGASKRRRKSWMSYTSLKYHVTFSTKERMPWLTADILPRLCEYFGGMILQQSGHPIEINGMEDHVHLVLSIPPMLAVAKAIGDLKSNSTNWIHQTFPELRVFCWQKEYAAFTVSPTILPKVVGYVQGQQEHHRRNNLSFRDELIWLLKNHEIEFDEKYIQ